MHVSLQNIKGAKMDKEREKLTEVAFAIFADRKATRRFELEAEIKNKMKLGSESSAYLKACTMLELEIVKQDLAGFYYFAA